MEYKAALEVAQLMIEEGTNPIEVCALALRHTAVSMSASAWLGAEPEAPRGGRSHGPRKCVFVS